MFLFKKQELLIAESIFTQTTGIRFQDIDAAGFLFFARTFDLFHDAWLAFLYQYGILLDEVLRQKNWAIPLRHAEADYLLPLVFGETVVISLTCFHLATQEITLGWKIQNTSQQTNTVGQTVHTFIQPQNRQRIAIPKEICMIFENINT